MVITIKKHIDELDINKLESSQYLQSLNIELSAITKSDKKSCGMEAHVHVYLYTLMKFWCH